MVRIQFGDNGPKVVLVQIALTTRPSKARIRVDGHFGPSTQDAVKALQRTLHRPESGIVELEEWRAMMSAMPFATFDHADVDDAPLLAGAPLGCLLLAHEAVLGGRLDVCALVRHSMRSPAIDGLMSSV
jgi:peptidoglycan hydrolase-like protein with peptidoglycan-binding domain